MPICAIQVKRDPTTPYVLLIDQDPQYEGNCLGHIRSIVWFVDYGDLKTVADPKFLKNNSSPISNQPIRYASAGRPQGAANRATNDPEGNEWFVHGTFKLLQADVASQVQATERVVETTTKESATIAGQIDRRFDSDANSPNEWRLAPRGVIGGAADSLRIFPR